MLTLNYVEDYIEYLSGYSLKNSFKNLREPNFRLARYDINVINNMSSNTSFGIALTDRQAELAVKLILKYRRQFQKHEVDISPIEDNPVFRITPRRPNRDKTAWFENGKILVRFPYNNDEIKDLQNFKDESQGSVFYDRIKREWRISPTEPNIIWFVQWATKNKFDIDKHIKNFYNQIQQAQEVSYEIKLIKLENKFKITNATTSLNSYILDHAGGFGVDNVNKLIDHAGICEYTVDQGVLDIIDSKPLKLFGPRHKTHITPTPSNWNSILDYAKASDRYPICIYNPTMFDIDLSMFNDEDVVRFDEKGKTSTPDYNPYMVKVVYARTIPKTWNYPVPLLVTTFEMMVGGRRQDWSKRAEKLIYYGTTTITGEHS